MSTKEERAARLEKFNKEIDEFKAKVNAMADVREDKIATRHANYEERIVTARTKRDASKARLEETIPGCRPFPPCAAGAIPPPPSAALWI